AIFFLHIYGVHRALPSFPTRRFRSPPNNAAARRRSRKSLMLIPSRVRSAGLLPSQRAVRRRDSYALSIRELKEHKNPGVALRAGWEEVRLTVPEKELASNFSVNGDVLQRYLEEIGSVV